MSINITAKHLRQCQPKAENVELHRLIPLLKLFILAQFWVFTFRINVFNSNIANFDLPVVRIYVDWLAGQLAVDYVMLVQIIEAVDDAFAPAFHYFEAGRVDLLEVLADAACCY